MMKKIFKKLASKIKREWSIAKFIVDSKQTNNNWLFFQVPISYENYYVSMDITIYSVFFELQWGFRINSIFDRIRFRLVNNQKTYFEIVRDGIFFDELIEGEKLTLEYGKKYKISLIVNDFNYLLYVDDRCVINIKDNISNMKTGDFGLYLYENEGRKINAEIDNLKIEMLTT